MKKRVIISLFFPIISCLLIGCNISNNNSFSTSNDSLEREKQAFYNRVILDYYEQRIAPDNAINMYLHRFEKVIKEHPELSKLSIDKITIYDLLEAKESGAHILNVSAYSLPTYAGNVFYYAFDGNQYEYINATPLDVYYKGEFYYLTDAYFLGLISKDDVLSALSIPFNGDTIINEAHFYDDKVDAKEKEDDQEDFSNTLLQTFRNELSKVIDNDNLLKDKNVSLNDIHVYQHFSESDGCYCVNFSIDNINPSRYLIEPINKKWEDSLILKDRTIEPFKDTYPVVWVNDTFYSIDEAIALNHISETTAVKLLDNYKISSSLDNGHLIAY